MTHAEQEVCEASRHKNHRSSAGSESWILGIRDHNERTTSSGFVSIARGVCPPWFLHTEPVEQPVQESLAAWWWVCSSTQGLEATVWSH